MICHQLNLIIFIWELITFSGIVAEKKCALERLFDCSNGETCEQLNSSTTLGVCKCRKKYKPIGPNSGCALQVDLDNQNPSSASVVSESGSDSAIVGQIVTVLLLITLAVLLVFAAKKYRWVQRIREKAQRYRARHYDTVLISQEDDPPLA